MGPEMSHKTAAAAFFFSFFFFCLYCSISLATGRHALRTLNRCVLSVLTVAWRLSFFRRRGSLHFSGRCEGRLPVEQLVSFVRVCWCPLRPRVASEGRQRSSSSFAAEPIYSRPASLIYCTVPSHELSNVFWTVNFPNAVHQPPPHNHKNRAEVTF